MQQILSGHNILNFIIGLLVGFYPFVTWKLAAKRLLTRPRAALILGFIFLKLAIIGVALYLLSQSAFFALIPFSIGMLLVSFGIIIALLITTKEDKQQPTGANGIN